MAAHQGRDQGPTAEEIASAVAQESQRKSDRDLLIETRVDVAVLLQYRQIHGERIEGLEASAERHERFVQRAWGVMAAISALFSFLAFALARLLPGGG